jgi:hypothetical protein
MDKYIEIMPVTFTHDGYVAKFSAPCLGAGWASAPPPAAAPGVKEVARLLDYLGVPLDATVDVADAVICAYLSTLDTAPSTEEPAS